MLTDPYLPWTLDLHVDWFVASEHHGKDVVTRELDHVRDFREFSANFARSLSGNVNYQGFRQAVADCQARSAARYDPDRLRGGQGLNKLHNLDLYPPKPVTLPEHENTANEIPYIPVSGPPY